MQMILSPLDDASTNPWCEYFSLAFDGGFDSNVSIGEGPEIEFPICDLIPVIINAGIDISDWFSNVLLNYYFIDSSASAR